MSCGRNKSREKKNNLSLVTARRLRIIKRKSRSTSIYDTKYKPTRQSLLLDWRKLILFKI